MGDGERRLLDGTWGSGSGAATAVVEKATQHTIGFFDIATAEDVHAAIPPVQKAQAEWSQLAPEEKSQALERLRSVLSDSADDIAMWLMREGGATEHKAHREIRASRHELARAAEMVVAEHSRHHATAERHHQIRRTPIGVVGVITPFNAPLILAMRAIAPSLAAGNGVILKPDPRTAVAGGLLYPKLLAEAGIPPELLRVLPGGADVGQRISEHPEIGSVLFTGSTPAGRKVGEAAGRSLKRVGLELGGNNPVIVLDDANVDAAVSKSLTSSFLHAGQICMAAGQYFVAAAVYDEFVEKFSAGARHLSVGDPWSDRTVDMGPIIDGVSASRLQEMVDGAVSAGAQLVAGGQASGLYFPATVLADVPEGADAWRAEAFGPVAAVRPFTEIDEVLSEINNAPYALTAGVHSENADRAQRTAESLPAGTVRINDVTNHDDPYTPMVGHRGSGNGSAFGGCEMDELISSVQVISRTT